MPDVFDPCAALAALRLQWEWGAEDGLQDLPVDRRRAADPSCPAPALLAPPDALPAALTVVSPAGPGLPPQAIASAARTLAELRAGLDALTDCALRVTAGRTVFAEGSDTARLVVVNDVPEAEDDRGGSPLSGPAGQLFDRMIGSIGLDRSAMRIVQFIPWRPPGNRPPSEAEIACCLPFLRRHLQLVSPDRIVLLGGLVAKALLGRATPIRRLRGTWQILPVDSEQKACPVLPLLHPASLLTTPALRRDMWADLLRLRRSLDAVKSGEPTDANITKS